MVFVEIPDLTSLLVLIGIFMAMGVVPVVVIEWLRAHGTMGIAEVYSDSKGNKLLAARKRIDPSKDTFTVGQHQFVIDPEKVARFTKWNRWGGRVPTWRYDMRDSIPVEEKVDPSGESITRVAKPSSATVNMIFRRGGLKAMLQATKSVGMDPKIAVLVGLVAGAGIAYLLLSMVHPGLVPAAPAGYHYFVQPDPINVTVTKP